MKQIRILTLIGGLVILALAAGFVFRVPLAISIWPWEDGRENLVRYPPAH